MLYLIEPSNYEDYREDLDNMYRFRHRIFFDKMQWDVKSQDGMEKDEYDEKNAYYLVYKDEGGIIRGCVRFIEMIHLCMFDGVFNFALPNVHEFKRPKYWEASRLAVDTEKDDNYNSNLATMVVKQLLAGLIEFGLYLNRVECYVVFTYISVQELAKKYGLLNYDISGTYSAKEKMLVWGFTPMFYSLSNLVKGYKYLKNKRIINNLLVGSNYVFVNSLIDRYKS